MYKYSDFQKVDADRNGRKQKASDEAHQDLAPYFDAAKKLVDLLGYQNDLNIAWYAYSKKHNYYLEGGVIKRNNGILYFVERDEEERIINAYYKRFCSAGDEYLIEEETGYEYFVTGSGLKIEQVEALLGFDLKEIENY